MKLKKSLLCILIKPIESFKKISYNRVVELTIYLIFNTVIKIIFVKEQKSVTDSNF